MRPIFTIFALIFTLTLCSCGGQVIDYDENKEYIEKKKNITYYKGTPFSGTIIKNHYENGQLKEKETFKDGKLNGPYESYYENGTKKEKRFQFR